MRAVPSEVKGDRMLRFFWGFRVPLPPPTLFRLIASGVTTMFIWGAGHIVMRKLA